MAFESSLLQSYGSKTTSKVPKEKPIWSCKLIVILFIIFSIFCLFIWAIATMDIPPPQVLLKYLRVSNFEVLDSQLVAEWVAGLLLYQYVHNPTPNNGPLMSSIPLFERIEAFISYKDHVLAVNSSNIMPQWGRHGISTIGVKFSTKDLEEDQREGKDWVLEDIRKDRENGVVIFGMEIVVWTLGYRRSFWAQCPKLKVDFNQPEWEAAWPRRCHVSKWYHPLNTLYR